MVTRVCVLRSGGEYTSAHVRWLARQIPGLVCISDVIVDGVETIKMPNAWPGWWSKMNLFDPQLTSDDLLYFDLDTVVLGDVGGLEVGRTTMLSDFYKPHMPASGLMYIRHEDKEHVWREWEKNPASHMRRCTTREHWGDQGFLRGVLHAERWDRIAPGSIVSYKVHCKSGLPDDALVVCFHGQPRPWQVKAEWIPK